MAAVRNTLTVEVLRDFNVYRRAMPEAHAAGLSDYWANLAEVRAVERRQASLVVRERAHRGEAHVEVHLNDGAVSVSCSCGAARGEDDAICRHKVAALNKLSDHLRTHPMSTWETLISSVMEATPRIATGKGTRALLVLSLQNVYHGTWTLRPYTLPATDFPEEIWHSPEQVARYVRAHRLSTSTKAVRSASPNRRFVNASEDAALAASALSLSQRFYYDIDNALTFDVILPRLAGIPVFRGTDNNPLQHLLRCVTQPARSALRLEDTPDGLMLRCRLSVDGTPMEASADQLVVVSREPLWLMANDTLFPAQGTHDSVQAFLRESDILVPPDEREHFLDNFLAPLAERVPVEGPGIAWEDVVAEPETRLYLQEEDGEFHARLRFAYGGREMDFDKDLPETSTFRRPGTLVLERVHRTPALEQERWQALKNFGLKRGATSSAFLLRANTTVVDFLLKQVPRLAEAGYTVFGEEALTSARINRHRPTLSFNVSSGIDWFDVDSVMNFGDIGVSLGEIRRAVKKRERFVKLADGSLGVLPEEWLKRFRSLFALGEETEEGVRLSSHHVMLLDQLLNDVDEARVDAEFERRRQRLRDFSSITPRPLPAGFQGEMRPYQKAGYDWLHFLHEYEFGGCLADDMGLGKTVQALAFLLSLRESGEATGPDLIVLPRSLLFNWKREAERFTPDLKLFFYSDKDRPKDVSAFDGYDLVLTTYGLMLRDIDLLRQRRFHYVLMDESQAIKNPVSQTARAARLLNADHRLALTGTPVENSTMELWSQFAFLNPGLLGNLEYFRVEFGTPIEKRQDTDAAAMLRRMVYPFILRRTKDQVAPELPPRTERILLSDMEPAQRKVYEKWRDYYRAQVLGLLDEGGMNDARMKVLEGLLRLRQLCNDPRLVEKRYKGGSSKFDLLLETLETLRAEGHKALVFSQFVQMLTLVREALDARGIPYAYLDGKTKDRQAAVDAFQANADLPFFLVSLKAGGVGLNLTAADYVVHVDPWWNPAVEMQATDRTHRIGQDKPVFVYKLIAADSVEEKILQLQDRKRELVSQLVSTESNFLKSLTRDDVDALFR